MTPAASEPPPVLDTPPPAWSQSRGLALLILVALAALTVIIAGRNLTVGGFEDADAAGLALRGLIISERAAGADASTPAWARPYAASLECQWDVAPSAPLVPGVEAVAFSLAGASAGTARAVILIFVVAAVWLVYLLARDLFGATVGVASAVLLITAPSGMTYARRVGLEWPALLFILVTLVAYLRYQRQPGAAAGVVIALACVGAYLTRPTALFGPILILITAWWDRRWRTLLRPAFAVPVGAAIIVNVAYTIAVGGRGGVEPEVIVGTPPLWHLVRMQTWTWYFHRLPAIVGWPMLVVAAAGVLSLALRYARDALGQIRAAVGEDGEDEAPPPAEHDRIPGLLAVWLFVWWLVCSAIAQKDERYFFYAVPALAVLTAAWLGRFTRGRSFGAGSVALVALCAVSTAAALLAPVGRRADMRPTVAFLASRNDAHRVLIDTARDGQFIFDVATDHEARDRLVPLPAVGSLYIRDERRRYDYESVVKTADDLQRWIERERVSYVVVDVPPRARRARSPVLPPQNMLREALGDTRRFERVHEQPLPSRAPAGSSAELVTYRYRGDGG